MKKYKLISCSVFKKELTTIIDHIPHIIDTTFLKMEAHLYPEDLRMQIQREIDKASREEWDAILLAYGLCGKSTEGIVARHIPVIIPRAHDCCTLFLGSKKKFKDYFQGNPSQSWTCSSYMENGSDIIRHSDIGKEMGWNESYESLVEKYGEDNAQYIYDTLHPKNYYEKERLFITLDKKRDEVNIKKLEKALQDEEKTIREVEGSYSLLENLVKGNWHEEDFIVLNNNEGIKGIYDFDKIIAKSY